MEKLRQTTRRWLPLFVFVATFVTAILDTSKVYIFWNENYELSTRQLHRLVCYDWHNFTFLVHDVVYDQVMNAEIDCPTQNMTVSMEVDPNGQSLTRRLSMRPATQFFQITPLLFEDPIWRNFTEADIFIAVLYQAFLPHEHIDSMMNHVSQSSIFVIAWSQAAFFDLDKSTKAHERNFLIMMSNVIPAHERPKLLELPIPIEELLDDEKEEDGTTSLSELTLQLLESSLSKWMKQRAAIATNRDQLLLSNDAIVQTEGLQGNCTGPRPSGTEFVCDEISARDYIKPIDFDYVDENYMPHYNSWDIQRTFDGSTTLGVRKIAASAHLLFIQGNLPDPTHSNIDIDPLCVASNMTNIDIRLARKTIVSDPRQWSSATTLAAAERNASIISPFQVYSGENGVLHNDQKEKVHKEGEVTYEYPLEYDTGGHVVSPFHRFDPRYREKILCMTYTVQGYIGAPGREDYGRARAIEYIRSTWGKRCDGYLAISNVTDHNLSTIHVEPMRQNWTENYHEMWLKAQLMWKLVGSTLLDEYDYFLIGGDDLYVIVENLRAFLARPDIRALGGENGRTPVYLGRVLQQNQYITFNTGGAGYLLNAAAVAALYRRMDHAECMPAISTSMEDVMVGQCLRYAGVYPIYDTSDMEDLDMNKAQALRQGTTNIHNLPPFAEDSTNHGPTVTITDGETNENQRMKPPQHHYNSRYDRPNDPLFIFQDISPIGKGRNLGKERFHPQSPNVSYAAEEEWYQSKANSYGVNDSCCSMNSITYQDIRGGAFMTCFHAAIYQKA